MSQNEKQKHFETIIDVIDYSGEFMGYWVTAMKEHLNSTFCSIGLMDSLSTLKSMTSLNLSLREQKEDEPKPAINIDEDSNLNKTSLLTINVLRICKESDFGSEAYTKFKESAKPTQLLIALMNASESSEKGVNACTKFLEKIKKDLGMDISLVPFVKNINGPIYSAIELFFKDFKLKVSGEFNKKLIYYSQYFEQVKEDKELFNDEDKVYEYLKNKQNYLNYLSLSEFYNVVQGICNDDLFKMYKVLNKPFVFTEPFSYMDFNERMISQKIKEKSLCNLEYQQFLFYYYIKSCKHLKDYNELNNFFFKITNEIVQYTSSFKSMFHFYFWNYMFTSKFLQFYKSLKKNFKNEEEANSRGQISILYYMKKIMKNYAISAKIEIPNEKIFTLALNNESSQKISNEMNSALNSINEEIENNPQYINFIDEIKENFKDEKMKSIFIHQKHFFEEYLLILKTLYKLHTELNQNHLSIRVAMESIPIFFALSNFDEVKKHLISLMQREELKGQKWEYIYEYLNFALIILLNCLERSNENLTLLLKCIDIKMGKISELIKIVNSDNINIIAEIISKFIDSYSISLENLPAEFNMNKIIDISFGNNENKILYTNTEKNKNFVIQCDVINNTGFFFNVDKIKIKFEEMFTKEKVEYTITENVKKIKTFTPNEKNELTIEKINEIFKTNSIYELKEIHFIVKNGICGIFTVSPSKTIKLNIKTIDTETLSAISPSFDTENLDQDNKNIFYFNILSKLSIKILNLPDDMSDKSLSIEIVDENDDAKNLYLKFKKNFLIDLLPKEYAGNIEVYDKKIIFPQHFLNQDTYNKIFGEKKELNIPFIVEDINYYTNGEKKIKIITSIHRKDQIIYTFAQEHSFPLTHLFSLKEKFRLMKNNLILMQTTFSLNLEMQGINIYLPNDNKNILNLDFSQAINFVLTLKNDKYELSNQLSSHFLKFFIGNENNLYRLCYPELHITEEVKQIMDMPYYIEINIENAEHKIFEEFSVNVLVKKYCERKTLLMLKMKESDNWSVIGKSKIIENMSKGNSELKVQFKLFPLQDGYLKIPEIDFMEYEIKEEETQSLNYKPGDNSTNVNFLEFTDIKFGSVIEGNERIVKINSINSCTLRLNLT